MRQQREENVAEKPKGRLGSGRQQQQQETEDVILRESLAFDLCGQQLADQVFLWLLAALVDDRRKEGLQRARCGQAGLGTRGAVADQIERPLLELVVVADGHAKEACDDGERIVAGELAYQLGARAVALDGADALVDQWLDQHLGVALDGLRAEGAGHQAAMHGVRAAVHLENCPAHHRPHDLAHDARRERLGIAQDL